MSAQFTARVIEQIAETSVQINPAAGAVWQFLNGLIAESCTDSITAFAGGGQTSAVKLTTEVNRITTVATSGDSVMLPPSVKGMTIILINSDTKPMAVFGAGTDTIDDVATATGVTQMQGSACIYTCTTAGKWYTNGLGTGYSGSFPTVSSTDAMTALAGGAQAGTPLKTVINRFTTVATAADSAQLPVSAPGMQVVVINGTASTSMNVFGQTGDKINQLAANSAFAVGGNKTASFYCTVAGQWHSQLTA